MEFRIDNIPTLHTETSSIEAPIYNRIRLGLLRTELPLRIPLTGLRGMDMVLDHKAWVCLDRTFYDLPVLAWADFEPSARSSLQDPVACRIHYYHVHADFIVNTVLCATVNALRARAARGMRVGEHERMTRLDNPRVIALAGRSADFAP